MANDERVEAAARGAAMYDEYDGCFERVDEWEARPEEERIDHAEDLPGSDYDDCEWWRRRMRAALSAAGVDALEAENARLREAVSTYDGFAVRYSAAAHRIEAERDAARRELADLRAGVEALDRDLDLSRSDGRIWTYGQIQFHLRALLAAAPSEPAPEVGPVVVSAWRYDQAVEDVTVGSIADDAGYDPGEVVDHVISALGITVTEDAP